MRGFRRGKYGNRKAEEDGYKFDSIAELDRYRELRAMQKCGLISRLEVHPVLSFVIDKVRIFKYIADFTYVENSEACIEDVKGVETDVFKLKFKLIRLAYPTHRMFIYKKGVRWEFVLKKSGAFKKINLAGNLRQ